MVGEEAERIEEDIAIARQRVPSSLAGEVLGHWFLHTSSALCAVVSSVGQLTHLRVSLSLLSGSFRSQICQLCRNVLVEHYPSSSSTDPTLYRSS